MASADQLGALRRAANVADTDATYTDTLLGTLIDALGVNGAAAVVWREKAAKFAEMVSMSEAGSSRDLSALHDQALKMEEMYARLAATDAVQTDPENLSRFTYTLGIERV